MPQASEQTFMFGVIEGFFGIPWSWEARRSYADFLQAYGFNAYLYAPKNDGLLRKDWHQPFPPEQLEKLVSLAQHYRMRQLNFGIGLSPYELYRDFSPKKQQQLLGKLEQINAIGPSVLCVLFDDMQGDIAGLAQEQVKITEFIIKHSQASRFIFCPSYYSNDTKLVQHFGAMPQNYLPDLGNLLDPLIDIFWTGPLVFSREYPKDHLLAVTENFKRKPIIWDNYPVNDAERLCDYLHLDPFPDQTDNIREYCAGHLANPMNQACLSQLSLYTLAQYYRGLPEQASLKSACEELCSAGLATQLLADARLFQETGLQKIDANSKAALLEKYSHFTDEGMAREVMDWIAGQYAFDPACLT